MSDVNPCFSEDIWFEILKNLPVKTVGKCRCVCKSWHSLIVSPSFMAAHFKHYTRNDNNTLLLYREMSTKIPRHEQYRFFLDSGRIPFQLCHTSICPFKVHVPFMHCSFFVGSIHGLLCLSDAHYLNPTSQIMLWNPFLQKMINLPTSTAATSDLSDITSVLGFAFNDNKNDHRLVKISFSRGNHPLVEVYSVWDRIWRTISAEFLLGNSIRMVSSSHCLLNGAIHWLTSEDDYIDKIDPSIGKWVLLFDVVEETFQKIELSEDIVTIPLREVGIFEYKSNLSVSHCSPNCSDTVFSSTCRIWVKEADSWCMILNVVLGNQMHIGPINYVGKNGEIFGFANGSDEKLMLYDVITRQFTAELGLGRQHISTTKFAAFTESLVLLDQNADVYTDDELQRSVKNRRRGEIFIVYSPFDYGDPFPEPQGE